jgi:DNA/RNA-binding domain of Phe-tRNA-synthetase-like protein
LAQAFIARWRSALGQLPPLTEAITLLTSQLGSSHALPLADATLRAHLRDMLRHKDFKPTGRSKPSSEYLARANSENTLRSINPAVDAGNAVSLHSGLPISVVDWDRLSQPIQIRRADKADSYVFNPTGQVIELAGLVCLFDALGPCANAIKDAQRTKTSDTTQITLSIVWSSQQLAAHTNAALELYRTLLAGVAEIESVVCVTLPP